MLSPWFSSAPGQILSGLYNPWLVTLSVAVAIFNSVLALQMVDLAGRGTKWLRMATLATASISLGAGVWTMHFVAMLAFNLCTEVIYDPLATAVSILPSLGASAIALNIISRPSVTRTDLLVGAVLVGGGIGAMHYVGMSAMRMVPVLRYDPWFFALSIIVAVGLAFVALWIRFGLRARWEAAPRLGGLLASGTVMGLAISGMHYTGMAAARFYGDAAVQDPGWRPQAGFLALGVTFTTLMVALLAAASNAVLRYQAMVAELKANLTERRRLEHDLRDALARAEQAAEPKAENTIRAKTEEALRASRRRLVSITDGVAHSILVLNPAGQIVFANLAARRTLGADELEGLSLDDFLMIREEGEKVPFARSPLSKAVEDGASVQDHDAVLHFVVNGVDMPAAYSCEPLGEDSWKRNVVMSFRDITDIKHAQRELLQSSRLASVGQLAAGIAHEINTPIQYIGNNLSFIADSIRKIFEQLKTREGDMDNEMAFLAEELPGAVSESLDGVTQISRIVLSMKEFSHPGSATKTLVNLNRALDTTLTVTANVWKQAAAVQRDYDPELPPVPCFAGELNQVFLNLIVNAAQAIEGSGKPRPGTIAISTAQSGDYAKIQIADSGTGIPAALLDKIFDPFFTTKEIGKGTGQGLAICQNVIVVKHGGKIEVGGLEGQGAVFTIYLPFDQSQSQGE